MPKLPALNVDKVIKILKAPGFILDRTKGSHHIYYNPQLKKRVIGPYHKKNLPKGTLLSILKQAGLSKEDL